MALIAVSDKFVWNLIFTIPFVTGILMVFLSALGMARTMGHGAHLGHGAGHGHAHVPGSHGTAHAGHTAHTGHAAPAHGHAAARGGGMRAGGAHRGAGRVAGARGAGRGGGGKGGGAKGARTGSSLMDALAIVGVGKVPFPVIVQTLLISWGLIGVESQRALAKVLLQPGVRIFPSMAIALVGAMLTTRLAAEVLGRVTPQPEETYALTAEDLVGTAGEVIYRVTETTGSLHVYDGTGALHELRARCRPGHPALEKGVKAVVVDYDPTSRWYWVERWQEGGEERWDDGTTE